MPLDRNTLKTVESSDRSFDDYMGQAPMVSSSEATDAAYDLAWQDSAVGLVARYNANKQFESSGAKPLTPDEANKMYPDMDEPFRDPVNPYVAQMKHDTVTGRRELEQKIQEGPQDRWTKTKVFGAGMLAHMADPIEFGAGAIVGWGVGGLMAEGAFGAGAAKIAGSVASKTATIGEHLAYDAAQGGGGAFVQSVAQEGAQKVVEGNEGIVDPRSNYEIATDVLFGTVAAFGMQSGGKLISHGLGFGMEGTKRFLRGTSPEADLVIARNIVASVEREAVPNVRPILDAIARETNVPHEAVGYDFVPFKGGSLEGKKLFTAVPSHDGSVTAALGNDYGFGTHITDNPGVANAAANRGFADGAGTLREVAISDLKPLNIDGPFEPNLAKEISGILKRADVDIDPLTSSASDMLSYVRNAVDAGILDESSFNDVQVAIKGAGYDSLISEGRNMDGVDHLPHNHITLLDDGKMEVKGDYAPNNKLVENPSDKDIADFQKQAEQPKRLFQDDTYDQTRTRVEEDMQSLSVSDNRKQLDIDMEALTSLKDQGLVTDADIVKVKELIAQADDSHKALLNYAACVRNT